MNQVSYSSKINRNAERFKAKWIKNNRKLYKVEIITN